MKSDHRIDIVSKMDSPDGSYVGGGVVSGNPTNKANVVGFRMIDKEGDTTYWMDMSPMTALAIIHVLTKAVMVYAATLGQLNPRDETPDQSQND